MEMTNLLFIVIFFGVTLTAVAFLYGDLQINYSTFATNSPAIPNFTSNVNILTSVINNSTGAIQSANINDPTITAFGFLSGAISGIKILISTPTIVLSSISLITATSADWYPAWINIYLIATINLIVLIGLLYYYMKVK